MQDNYELLDWKSGIYLSVDFQPKSYGDNFEEDEWDFIYLLQLLSFLGVVILDIGYDGLYYTISIKVK